MRALCLMVAGLVLSACSQSFSPSNVDWGTEKPRQVTAKSVSHICNQEFERLSCEETTDLMDYTMIFSSGSIEILNNEPYALFFALRGAVRKPFEIVNLTQLGVADEWETTTNVIDFNDDFIVIEEIWETSHNVTGAYMRRVSTITYFFE